MRAPAPSEAEAPPDRADAFLRALAGGGLVDARRVAVAVAHAGDETIALGGQLARLNGATVIHATDGAPPSAAAEHGFAEARDYAFARACELERAMMLAGVPVADRFCLGVPAGEAALRLTRLTRALMRMFDQRAIEVVLTHAYEGGCPDRDATAFAVHAARRLLARKQRALAVVELPRDRMAAHRAEILTLALDERARAIKREMLAAYRTQAQALQAAEIDVERFRVAADCDFAQLPNAGKRGVRWLALVEAASAELGLECVLGAGAGRT